MTSATDELDKLDEAFKTLRVAYEKYFAGVDKLEPAKDRDKFRMTLRRLMTERTSNTARRYRLQSLQASLITYENYWNRLCRQIEDGTFKRDKWRVKVRFGDAPDEEIVANVPADKATPTAPALSAAQYPASLVKLHEAYVRARESVGDTRPVPMDVLAATVKKQIETLRERYGAATVEFKVAVKDGRAILKAVPKGADGGPIVAGDAAAH